MLVFKVEPVVKQASVGEVDGPGGIVKAIGDIKVQIFREMEGIGILWQIPALCQKAMDDLSPIPSLSKHDASHV